MNWGYEVDSGRLFIDAHNDPINATINIALMCKYFLTLETA